MAIDKGTKVEYFGSLDEYWGVLEVIGHHPPLGGPLNEHDTIRYVLARPDDKTDYIHNVRSGSFYVRSEDNE